MWCWLWDIAHRHISKKVSICLKCRLTWHSGWGVGFAAPEVAGLTPGLDPRSSEDRSSRMFFSQVVRGRPGGCLQFSGGGSKMAWLAVASAFSSIHARCPKKVRRKDLMMDESRGWLAVRRVLAFLTNSCQRMSRILRRHHLSTASIRCISALLIAQHSDP